MIDIEKVRAKCQKEYEEGFNHIRTLRDKKRLVNKKILEEPEEGYVKSNMLWKNMQLELATFLTDSLDIVIVSDKGVLEDEITKTAEKVAQYDYRKLEMRDIKRKIIDDNCLYGLAVTFIDGYDEVEQLPLVESTDVLSVIGDPHCYSGSKMRFFGLEKQFSIEYVREKENFSKKEREEVVAEVSTEWQKTRQAIASANSLQDVPDDEMVSIYYHFTTYEGVKYMFVWANDFQYLLRTVEIEPMTKSEKLKPTKVRFPVQLHRRKPIPGSFFGASLYDELIQYQKAESELMSMKLAGVRIEELGSDKLFNIGLGESLAMSMKDKKLGGNTYFANFSNLEGQPAFIELPLNKTGGRVDGMLQQLERYAQDTSGNRDVAFGSSPSGSRTKAEVQILEQKSNKTHMMVRDNYMDSYQQLWEDILRSYSLYMGGRSEKTIALLDSGKVLSKKVKKKDFLPSGSMSVYIESRDEQKAKANNDFTKLVTVSGMIMANMKPGYAMDEFQRLIISKSGIEDIDPLVFIPESPDEIEAKNNIELLNNDIEISDPLPNQDLHTLRQIYSQALNTKAKYKILERIDQLIMDTIHLTAQAQAGQTDSQSSAMAMQSVLAQSNNNPTLGQ